MRISRIPEISYHLPQPLDPPLEPAGFLLMPLAIVPVTLEQLQVQLWLYRAALEEARAVARPSLPERDLLGIWN
jgi:hypothetical protein